MTFDTRVFFIVISAALAVGVAVGTGLGPTEPVHAQDSARVFELRTYTAPEGRLDRLEARFRDHTMRLFEKHGMTNIGYWRPQDEPASANTLIYIISHRDRESAARNWQSFRDDPDWKQVSTDTQLDGPIVSNVVSVFMDATDFSPLK